MANEAAALCNPPAAPEAAELFEALAVPEPLARALEHKPWVPCSQWCEQHIVIPPVKNAVPGPWRNEVAPYLAHIMDTASQPHVREVVVCSGSQLGKTQWAHNYLGYRADRDPAPTLVVMSDEVMAGRIVSEKLKPLWLASPALRATTRGVTDALRGSEFHLNNGMSVHLAWASSESKLASIPFAVVVLDEVDKYPTASAVPNAKARTRWFPHTKKIIEVSTPTTSTGQIYTDLLACDVIYQRHVPCPECGEYQKLVFEHIQWPDDERDPGRIRKGRLARYRCRGCGSLWTDTRRDLAERHGEWRPVYPDELSTDRRVRAEAEAHARAHPPEPVERPQSVGYQISSLHSHFVSLSEIAAKFLRATQSSAPKAGLQDLYNNEFGEPFDDLARVENPAAEALLGLRVDLPAGVAPAWTTALVASIDMQRVGFWYSVWAFERSLDTRRRHLVNHGYLPDWQAVDQLVFGTRYRVDGHPGLELPVWRAPLDTGGGLSADGDWSRTAEAYQWVRAHGRGVVWAVKGQPRRPNQPRVRHSVQDRLPGRRGGAIPGGLVLWLVDAPRFKDDLFAELAAERTCPHPACATTTPRATLADRGGMCPACGRPVPGWRPTVSLHADTDEAWARQMLAEEKRRQKNGTYEWTQTGKDNHYLDCAVYAWAAASPEWAGGVAVLAEPTAPAAPPRRPVAEAPANPLAGRTLNPRARS